MVTVMDVLSALIMIWFSLLFIGFKRFCGRVTFKESDDWQYIVLEFMLILYFVGNLEHWYFVIPMMAVVFLLWDFLQFRAHWLPSLIGVSDSQLETYYQIFGGNLYILPRSRRRIIPDAYHTIQHVLMVLNTLAVFMMLRY